MKQRVGASGPFPFINNSNSFQPLALQTMNFTYSKIKHLFLLLLALGFFPQTEAQEVNISSELQRLIDMERLPEYVDQTRLLQVSSYDTTGGNNDGFSGQYSFLYKNPDSSLVIFEEQGKGVINRIWTPTPTEDTLDFFYGGAEKPSFSIKFSDLFSADVYPFEEPLSGNEIGGYYTYVPIPFEDGLKIVFRGKKLEFYQIQHRALPDQYEVENFSMDFSSAERNLMEQLKRSWAQDRDFSAASTTTVDTRISPGETITLANYDKGGRILGFEFDQAQLFEGLNKQLDLRITWDNEQVPALYLPLADYFGYAFGKTSMQSLLLGTKDNMNYSYLPMPFDKTAKVELIYRASDKTSVETPPLDIKARFYASDKERIKGKEGKFYTFWNKDLDAPLGVPHQFLKGKGKGHYVGTIMQTQGLRPGMTLFFEGDDVTTIDGEMRIHGTGSEDYFNGGWYALMDRWDRKVSLPLHGSLDYSLPYARTGGYRLFISDKMPFEREIDHTMEHGPEDNNMPVDYTSVALYYAEAPVNSEQQKPTNELTGTYIPDTFILFPQLIKYTVAGDVNIQHNGEMLSSRGGMARIDLSELPPGNYKLYADMETGPQGGEITIWQRQKQVSDIVSFHSEGKGRQEKNYLSDVVIDDFQETITLRFVDKGDQSTIWLKQLILEKQD